MKITYTRIVFAAMLQCFTLAVCRAQSPSFPILQAPPAKIIIDGDIKEWGDSLQYYNKENQINYAISNDKENMYIAVRIKDRIEQIRVLNAGMALAVDAKGKKRNSYSITFPLNLRNNGSNADFDYRTVNLGPVTQQDRETLNSQKSIYLRGIKVDGFKDLPNGILQTTDSGILATINYDEHGYLVCEAVIPLKQFHVDDLYKNEWAFNFKINGLKAPTTDVSTDFADQGQQTNNVGGRNGGSRASNRGSGNQTTAKGLTASGPSSLYRSDDFWVKFYLAK